MKRFFLWIGALALSIWLLSPKHRYPKGPDTENQPDFYRIDESGKLWVNERLLDPVGTSTLHTVHGKRYFQEGPDTSIVLVEPFNYAVGIDVGEKNRDMRFAEELGDTYEISKHRFEEIKTERNIP